MFGMCRTCSSEWSGTLHEQTEQSAGCTTFWGGAEGIKMAELTIFMCNRRGICFAIRATYDNHQWTGKDKPSRLIYELADYIFVNFNYRDKFAISVSCKDVISEAVTLDFGNQWKQLMYEYVWSCTRISPREDRVGLTSLISITRSRTDWMLSLFGVR